MALFGFGKKQKEEGLPAACQCGGCTAQKDACRQEQKEKDCCGGAWNIRVLGTGCAACHALLENTKKAVAQIGLEATVEYVTDMGKIAQYGVMQLTALVVDGKTSVVGKVLKPQEIAAILKKQNR